jgi:hypothetical protein
MFKNYTLLRSQRNRVYELLRENGLEPAEFSWAKEEIAGSLVVSRLNYREGEYYFQFTSHEVNAWCIACPGQYRSLDYEYPKNWEEQEAVLRKWMQFLKRELAAPDPWGELAKYKVALGVREIQGECNEAISAVEAEGIGQALSRLADGLVRDLKLDEAGAAAVRAKLEYLAQAARRERSLDWVYTALGVCASLGAALALPESMTPALWEAFQKELGQYIHLTLSPGPGGPAQTRIVSVEPANRPSVRQGESHKVAW